MADIFLKEQAGKAISSLCASTQTNSRYFLALSWQAMVQGQVHSPYLAIPRHNRHTQPQEQLNTPHHQESHTMHSTLAMMDSAKHPHTARITTGHRQDILITLGPNGHGILARFATRTVYIYFFVLSLPPRVLISSLIFYLLCPYDCRLYQPAWRSTTHGHRQSFIYGRLLTSPYSLLL